MATAINGKPPATPSSPRFACRPAPYLSSRTSPCASLCLCNTLTHALEHQFPRTAASDSLRRRRSVAAGEGLDPPPVLFHFWDCQELNEHALLQVLVPDARGSRAPSSPERRPSRRRRRAPSLPPLLRP
jgi:hypothetical protein